MYFFNIDTLFWKLNIFPVILHNVIVRELSILFLIP